MAFGDNATGYISNQPVNSEEIYARQRAMAEYSQQCGPQQQSLNRPPPPPAAGPTALSLCVSQLEEIDQRLSSAVDTLGAIAQRAGLPLPCSPPNGTTDRKTMEGELGRVELALGSLNSGLAMLDQIIAQYRLLA